MSVAARYLQSLGGLFGVLFLDKLNPKRSICRLLLIRALYNTLAAAAATAVAVAAMAAVPMIYRLPVFHGYGLFGVGSTKSCDMELLTSQSCQHNITTTTRSYQSLRLDIKLMSSCPAYILSYKCSTVSLSSAHVTCYGHYECLVPAAF